MRVIAYNFKGACIAPGQAAAFMHEVVLKLLCIILYYD